MDGTIVANSCVIDNTSDDRRWLKKLHKHLKNDYNNIMQPNRARTKVNFGFFLRYYNFDDESHTFTVNGWLHLTWSDDRLTWNPEDFNGINKTNYWSYVFWAPILELNNRIENEIYETFYGMCSLESTGSVTCNPRVNEEVRCVSSVQNWPYDTKKCKLDYGISSLQNNVGLMLFLKPILAHTTKTEWILSQHSVIRNILRGPQAENWRVPLEVCQADGMSSRGESPLRLEPLDHSNLRGHRRVSQADVTRGRSGLNWFEMSTNLWDGSVKYLLDALDRLQRRAIRIIGDEEVTKHLEPLQLRHDMVSLSAFYRLYHGECSEELFFLIPPSPFIQRTTRAGLRYHRLTVATIPTRAKKFGVSFLCRTIRK
ncbi:unnamed protein product [Chilo suppressalis]|uniref:Neurotransmitter-gated ion-channel ligand-binding domain-containing protein n=1 Tax=Chilo suppressalis TaxID=168631 RepID=A0ABN8B396_CHISP|nr:unnamed protein product [Chilo suppressalis]